VLALLDESMSFRGKGLYLVAVVTVHREAVPEIRQSLRGTLLRRQRRFHWRDESEPRRLDMMKLIGDLEVFSFAFSRSPSDPKKQTRARRVCLEAVLWVLREKGIDEVVIESRGGQDRDDEAAILDSKRCKIADPNLLFRFDRPQVEPLLWLPDTVAGAEAACHLDPDCAYAEPLEALNVDLATVR
jgi:hypothetical protein